MAQILYTISMTLYFAIGAFGTAWGLTAPRRWQRVATDLVLHQICSGCGYSLAGREQGCPECGLPAPSQSTAGRQPALRSQQWRAMVLSAVAVLSGCGAAGGVLARFVVTLQDPRLFPFTPPGSPTGSLSLACIGLCLAPAAAVYLVNWFRAESAVTQLLRTKAVAARDHAPANHIPCGSES